MLFAPPAITFPRLLGVGLSTCFCLFPALLDVGFPPLANDFSPLLRIGGVLLTTSVPHALPTLIRFAVFCVPISGKVI